MNEKKKRIIIAAADIIIYIGYGLLGLILFIMWGLTTPDGKFHNSDTMYINYILLAVMFTHIFFGIFISVFFYKKERTKLIIKIPLKLMVINIVLVLLPYALCGMCM